MCAPVANSVKHLEHEVLERPLLTRIPVSEEQNSLKYFKGQHLTRIYSHVIGTERAQILYAGFQTCITNLYTHTAEVIVYIASAIYASV